MSTIETKALILDTAEKEFADRGFAGVSLRHVTSRAGVNLASVHYHFGSKEKLIDAIFERRVGTLTNERMQLLDACEAASGRGPLPLEAVIEAFVGPALRLMMDPSGAVFMRLIGRTLAEPSEHFRQIMNRLFGETVRRFFQAFQRALPQVPADTLYWRFQFLVGAMGYTMADPHVIKAASKGLCDGADTETAVRQLLTFLSAGLKAPEQNAAKSTNRGLHKNATKRRPKK